MERISSVAAVVNAITVSGPSATASSVATTLRAISGETMNGMRRRSNRSWGNWMSRALPMVSALIPVLSERKNTRTTGISCGTRGTRGEDASLNRAAPVLTGSP